MSGGSQVYHCSTEGFLMPCTCCKAQAPKHCTCKIYLQYQRRLPRLQRYLHSPLQAVLHRWCLTRSAALLLCTSPLIGLYSHRTKVLLLLHARKGRTCPRQPPLARPVSNRRSFTRWYASNALSLSLCRRSSGAARAYSRFW